MTRLCVCSLVAVTILGSAAVAAAQSTSATVFGTAADEQHAALPGVNITLRRLETGELRTATSDERGAFRIIGVAPGHYELRATLGTFNDVIQPDVVLGLNDELGVPVIMRIGAVTDHVTVAADVPIGGVPLTTLGRAFTTRDIEELPITGREVVSLAMLSPGIGAMPGTMRTTALGITAAGQNGRNNTFLIDGLSIDDNRQSNVRGTLPLDAIQEFMVLSNSFSAEYGQASGAVISVLTRSGANRLAGRAFYYHRDDSWDATSAAASLVSPPATKSRLEQQIVGGFVGGPIRRDRVFFFGSTEQTNRDTEQFVTSSVLQVYRPGADARLPIASRSTLGFLRGDVRGVSSQLTLRYRIDRLRETNQTTDPQSPGLIAPERRADVVRLNQDVGALHNLVLGPRRLNELKFQAARRRNESDVSRYCPGCVAENRPGLLLGKSPTAPVDTTQTRLQVLDAFTWLVGSALGDHTVKVGVDASVLRERGSEPAGFNGIFTFGTNTPFNAANATTYPTRYLRNDGDPETDFHGGIYAGFAQDSWIVTPRLTINAGVRWDYQDAPGISHDRDNISPRLGVAYGLRRDGSLVVRGSYGTFYDQVLLIVSSNALRAATVTQTLFSSPGYPDPFGPNPRRSGAINVAIPSTTVLAPDMDTPVTKQASVGIRHMGRVFALTVDGVWARGRHLLRSLDLNYPDLDNPARPRPNPAFQRILTRDANGNSWYRGLQAGLRKRHSARHSYAVTYTLSRAERDTEDFEFLANDQRDYAAERGPASSDARHRLSASTNADLPWHLRLTTLLTARSSFPYNITTGADDNNDLAVTDRPPGVSRNSVRGSAAWQLDLRLSKLVVLGRQRVELFAEVFNVTNQPNWTAFDGVVSNTTFGRPTSSGDPRQVQLGIRMDF
jgi:carboxypeptidase family protein/TonB-dependent receptor-like protein